MIMMVLPSARNLITGALNSSGTSFQKLKRIHGLLITSGLERSVFFAGKLISKYGEVSELGSSLYIFRQMVRTENVYLWNCIIRAFVRNDKCAKGVDIYLEMRSLKVLTDAHTFPAVISACAGLMDFQMGEAVHDHVMKMGFGSSVYIGNSLIDMYARFGVLGKARKVFEEMLNRDIVSWNSLISGYSANDCWEEALGSYYRLRGTGMVPDLYTVCSILPAFVGLAGVEEGEVIHGLVHKLGMNTDMLVCNALLCMYRRSEKFWDLRRVFDEMVTRDVVSWNTVVCSLSESGLFEESILLFRRLVSAFKPDLLALTSVFHSCSTSGDIELGRYAHDYMARCGYECDTVASNVLIDMYGQHGQLLVARYVFDRMKCRDSVSWNSMINCCIQQGFYDEGVKLFKMMKMETQLDSFIFVMLVTLSTHLGNRSFGAQLHCDILKMGFVRDTFIGNALTGMYAECGNLGDSIYIFRTMKDRDIVTWNTIIASSVHSGDCNTGLKMATEMRAEGVMPDATTMLSLLPLFSLASAKRQGKELHGCIYKFGFDSNVAVGNALIEMYSKCGDLKHALCVFEQMKVKDVVTWTGLISAYGMYGEGKKALSTFKAMEVIGIAPDDIAFLAVISACSHSGLTEEGVGLYKKMKIDYKIEPRREHYACVLDLLSRSGRLSEAEQFILSMPMEPDASIWGALLSASRSSTDTSLAERISDKIIKLNSNYTGYHVLVSNVFASLGRWDEVKNVRKSIQDQGLEKDPGCSWIEIQNRVYVFGVGTHVFEQYQLVHRLLNELYSVMA